MIMPWDGLQIEIGGVVLVWAGVVAGIIEVLKHTYFGERALLDTEGKIWAANLILGGLGMLIWEMAGGANIIQAAIAAVVAVVGASGIFEGIKSAAGKEKLPSGEETTLPANGDT